MKWLLAAVGCLVILSFGGVVSAHELQADHGISAVLHVAPDDKPVSGQLAQLQLSFGDERDAFTLQDCNCKLSIAQDETVVIARPTLAPPAGSTLYGLASYTWPQPGRYDVKIDGSSKDGAFPRFHLDFDVDVAPGQADARQRSQALWLEGVIVLIGLLALGLAKRLIRSR
jgi:hypothetical protein